MKCASAETFANVYTKRDLKWQILWKMCPKSTSIVGYNIRNSWTVCGSKSIRFNEYCGATERRGICL